MLLIFVVSDNDGNSSSNKNDENNNRTCDNINRNSDICAQASSGDNAQQLGQAIHVPTFPEPRQRAPVEDADALRSQDPFLYFSDQRRRMAHLTGNEEEVNDQDNPPQQQQRVVERRTRISFEVHPSLLLDDLLDDLFNNKVEEEKEEG